jgi:hypothetical protein
VIVCCHFDGGHPLDGLARADARRGRAIDGHDRIEVVAHHHHRARFVFDARQARQRHHAAALALDPQLRQVLDLLAELLVGLGNHLPGTAKTVEVVDVERAEAHLQGVEDLADLHALPSAGAWFGTQGVKLGWVTCVMVMRSLSWEEENAFHSTCSTLWLCNAFVKKRANAYQPS